ncbi:MAG: hypothetical protein VX278_02705 [Myxococcota bacterium]|nr:hypothetical protein [Myxococcota bacterium]
MSSFLMLMLACGAGDTLTPMLEGSISPVDKDISGTFFGYKAFGFDNSGTLVVYISSNAESTCTSVAEYLSSGRDPYDPALIFTPGTCNMMVKIGEYTSPWEEEDDRASAASSVINCAMGDGEFVYESSSSDDRDYYWSGEWFQGLPVSYKWEISGDRDTSEEYLLNIEMSGYEGFFPYGDNPMNRYTLSGDVQGTVTAEICTELGTTGLF